VVEQVVKMEEMQEMFELAPEEIAVCLRVKEPSGRYELLHRLRPPALDDWRAYERELRSTVEAVEDEPEALRFGSSPLEAAGVLYDRLFRGAEGYRVANGNGGITVEQIPLHHKEMVVRGLSDVAPASQGESEEADEPGLFSLDAERVEVALEATRNGKAYRNLVHVFRPPMAADRVEYSRVTSQALYVRNSQTLKTVLPSRLPGLAALYDRLIEEVRGYVAAGAPLGDRPAIIRQMDPLHKKVAVQILFGE
jgi:hypothetical protein